MLLYTKKQMEKEVERRMMEFDQQRWLDNRLREMDRQIDGIAKELLELRMKLDPEFKARMTPVCDCGTKDLTTPSV